MRAKTPQTITGFLRASDGEKIAFRHYRGRSGKIIVIAHGFSNSKDIVLIKKLANALYKTYDVLAFDFRGHGESSGLFYWTSKEGRDLNAVLKYLKNKYKKIGLIGFSLGGSISINVLSQANIVNSFVCVSAPSYIEAIDFRFWESGGKKDISYAFFDGQGIKGKGIRPGPFWLKKTRPIDTVQKINIPVLYIHGKNDWLVKPRHSAALFRKTRSRKRLALINTGTHSEYMMRSSFERIFGMIKNWFDETL